MKDDRSRWTVHVDEFAPWADALLASVTREQAREWWLLLAARRSSNVHHKNRTRPLAGQTLRNVLNLVRKAWDDAIEEGLVPSHENPFRALRLHRSRMARTTEGSTVVELHERPIGLGALPYPERWIAEVAIISGIRQGEQWSLGLDDVHVDVPRPYVKARFGSQDDGPTKAGKVHTIWLFGMALDAMRAWLAQLERYAPSNPLRLVFPTRSGKRRREGSSFRAFARLGKAIGRHVRWHDLRHSAFTALAGAWDGPEWSLAAIALQAGHSSTKVTERYVRLAAKIAERAAARMPVARRTLKVPLLARPVRRAFRRVAKHRGATVEKNDVDADTTAGENAGNGAVAKWLGIGLQNRMPPPEGGGETPQTSDGQCGQCAACAAELERERARAFENAKLLVLVCDQRDAATKRANENAEAHFGALKDCESLRVQLVAAQGRAIDAEREVETLRERVDAVRRGRDGDRVAREVAEKALAEARATIRDHEDAIEVLQNSGPRLEESMHRVRVELGAPVGEDIVDVARRVVVQRDNAIRTIEDFARSAPRLAATLGVDASAAHRATQPKNAATAQRDANGCVRCPYRGTFSDGSNQCGKAAGHDGPHYSNTERWPLGGVRDADASGVPVASDDVPRLDVVPAALHGAGAGEASKERAPEARTLGAAALTFAKGDRARIISGRGVGRVVFVEEHRGALLYCYDEREPRWARWAHPRELDIVPTSLGDRRRVGMTAADVARECGVEPDETNARRAASPTRAGFPLHIRADGTGVPAAPAPEPIEDAFRATELSRMREQPTRPELADADDGEERATLHLHREELLTLARTRTNERDTARALCEQEKREHRQTVAELLALKARHRTAIGLLNDVDRAGARIATFLSDEVKS